MSRTDAILTLLVVAAIAGIAVGIARSELSKGAVRVLTILALVCAAPAFVALWIVVIAG